MNRIWNSPCGKLTLQFTKRECDSVPNSGPADKAIALLMQSRRCMFQLAMVPDSKIISILQGYGCWTHLADDSRRANISRLLWVAIMDVKEFYFERSK